LEYDIEQAHQELKKDREGSAGSVGGAAPLAT